MEATALLPLGMGLIVLGAGLGIGRLASAAAEGIARQPEAADKISGAVNLPLFLLEGLIGNDCNYRVCPSLCANRMC